MKRAVRILLADTHDVMRSGLRRILEPHGDWQICGEASDGRGTVETAQEVKPDVVILDLEMPILNGLEVTRRLKEQDPNTEILIFTLRFDERSILGSLRAGALGYVLKSDEGNHLVHAVDALSHHLPYFTTVVLQTMVNAVLRSVPNADETAALTGRQLEIVQLVAEGRTNKEVASSLSISTKAVASGRAAIMRKLGLHSLADLVRFAVRNGIVSP